MTLELNKSTPEFELSDQNGETHKLSDYLGKRVVLYFGSSLFYVGKP